MNALIERHLGRVYELCRKHRVARLDLFGSATGDRFDPARSDIDFLVRFEPMTPVEHADAFFGLLQDLEDLFGRRIDLLEREPITNRYLLQSIDENRVQLYAA